MTTCQLTLTESICVRPYAKHLKIPPLLRSSQRFSQKQDAKAHRGSTAFKASVRSTIQAWVVSSYAQMITSVPHDHLSSNHSSHFPNFCQLENGCHETCRESMCRMRTCILSMCQLLHVLSCVRDDALRDVEGFQSCIYFLVCQCLKYKHIFMKCFLSLDTAQVMTGICFYVSHPINFKASAPLVSLRYLTKPQLLALEGLYSVRSSSFLSQTCFPILL